MMKRIFWKVCLFFATQYEKLAWDNFSQAGEVSQELADKLRNQVVAARVRATLYADALGMETYYGGITCPKTGRMTPIHDKMREAKNILCQC